jgi:hypothetical protein
MTQTVAQAQDVVDRRRAQLHAALPGIVEAFQKTLQSAFDQIIQQTVIKQPSITNGINAADLGALKFNINEASKQALGTVAKTIDELRFDDMARRAQPNISGMAYVRADQIIDPLLTPVFRLLERAGYNVATYRSGTNAEYSSSNLRGVDLAADTASRTLDRLIEDYGKAKFELRKAEDAVAETEARSAWDNA